MNYPIRRAQLISPFGPGAMSISKNGISAVCSGLDHWFKDRHGNMDFTDLSHYKIHEWRLQRMLGVDHFRLPPDFRTRGSGTDSFNLFLTVPFLRFPKWHYCTYCGQMIELQYYEKQNELCRNCERKGYKNYLVQTPFIAICERGHLQDFPWREWVHRQKNPSCQNKLYLISTGGGSLTSMQVRCDCGVEPRMLQGITSVYDEGKTELSQSLCEDGTIFLCQGKRPWLGTDESEECNCHLMASLRSASNVYFAQVRSAIFIPGNNKKQTIELLSLFEQPQVSGIIKLAERARLNLVESVQQLREQFPIELNGYSDSDIRSALLAKESLGEGQDDEEEPFEDMEASLRQEEYEVLSGEINMEELKIKPIPVEIYRNDFFDVTKYFSNINLVEKLKETRVLTGFNRVFNDQQFNIEDMKSMLWRKRPERNDDWLPAYVVFGEGIFFNFNEEYVRKWERRIQVIERNKHLSLRYQHLFTNRRTREKKITPRFTMAHTFAHLLMNQLIFECGYSSSSLRERLYVSDNESNPMCGVLIYTAAGDSDGTMGGLVRMGKPGFLEAVIRKALNNARWCSADPVCTEIGLQGPDSCNIAACHSCSLVPETACEEFNRFLDRGLVVQLHGIDPLTAFFN